MALECPPFSDFVILLVDLNAYRGNDTETWWGVTGRNGLPNVLFEHHVRTEGCPLSAHDTRTPWLHVEGGFCNSIIRSASISSGHLGEERN